MRWMDICLFIDTLVVQPGRKDLCRSLSQIFVYIFSLFSWMRGMGICLSIDPLVIQLMDIPFRSLLNGEYKGLGAHYCKV